MDQENEILKMEYLKKYQAQNNILAKTMNNLKCELKNSKDEIILLNRQLQTERERSIILETEQSELFNCLDKFDALLDAKFQQSTESYGQLSTIISGIKSKNPKNRTNDLNCAIALDCTFNATNLSAIGEVSPKSESNDVADMTSEHITPKSDLNLTILFDSDYISDESICREVVETIKLPENIAKSTSVDDSDESSSSRGRRVKRRDYREVPINRKLRRSQ